MRILPILLMLIMMPVVACSEQPGGITAQEQPPLSQEYPSEPQQEQALQIAEGELSRVDAQNQEIWLKSPDGQEFQFSYNAQTQVEGAGGSVEGLANMAGTQLRVHFQSDGDKRVAAKIEVLTPAG